MDFSVLISVYGKDNATFFKEALESVTISQTLKPTQVVIVEDGPVPSEIEEIIFSIKEKTDDIEYTILRKEKNAGLAAALNTGLKACKYDWVARMDSDDISVPERFEKQILAIERNPDINVIGGFIDEFAETIGDINSIRKVGLCNSEILKMAQTRSPMNHVTVMYKKNVILGVGGYSEDFGKLEDYKLWVDLLSGKVTLSNIAEVIVHVRVGNGFLERRGNKREIQDWDMLQDYLLKGRIVNRFQSFKNKIYIRGFIYTPAWIKKILYNTLLRG